MSAQHQTAKTSYVKVNDVTYAYRKLGEPKYWVVYHDMMTNYTGLVHRLLQIYDTPRTLEWALEREQKAETTGQGQSHPPNLVSIENGGQFVLG